MPSLNDILDSYSKLLVKAKNFSDEAVLWNELNKLRPVPTYLKNNMRKLLSQLNAFYQSTSNTAEDSTLGKAVYYFSQDYIAYSKNDENDNILSFLNPDLSIPAPFRKYIANFSHHLTELHSKAEDNERECRLLNPPLIQQLLEAHAKYIVNVLNFTDNMVKLAFKAFPSNEHAFSINGQQKVPLSKILKLHNIFQNKMEISSDEFSIKLPPVIHHKNFKKLAYNRIDNLYRFMTCLSLELRECYYQNIEQQLMEKKVRQSVSNETSQMNTTGDNNEVFPSTTLIPEIQEKNPTESTLFNFKALLQSRQASFPKKTSYEPIFKSVEEESCEPAYAMVK